MTTRVLPVWCIFLDGPAEGKVAELPPAAVGRDGYVVKLDTGDHHYRALGWADRILLLEYDE